MGGGRKNYYQRNDRRSNRFRDILKRGLYRSRNGLICGVCKGIAEYFNFSVFWTRIITIALFLITGFWPTGILYILAALLMKPEPGICSEKSDDRRYYDSYERTNETGSDRIRRRYSNLERRIHRLEHSMTSHESDWERRLNS